MLVIYDHLNDEKPPI